METLLIVVAIWLGLSLACTVLLIRRKTVIEARRTSRHHLSP